MKKDPDPVPSAAPATAARPRRRRMVALVNSSALLGTTALIAAIETKIPPSKVSSRGWNGMERHRWWIAEEWRSG